MATADSACGLDVALSVVGGKWKPLIRHLREQAAAGVPIRHDHQRVPPMVDYTMTPFGTTLAHALMPLCARGNGHRARARGNHVLALVDAGSANGSNPPRQARCSRRDPASEPQGDVAVALSRSRQGKDPDPWAGWPGSCRTRLPLGSAEWGRRSRPADVAAAGWRVTRPRRPPSGPDRSPCR